MEKIGEISTEEFNALSPEAVEAVKKYINAGRAVANRHIEWRNSLYNPDGSPRTTYIDDSYITDLVISLKKLEESLRR